MTTRISRKLEYDDRFALQQADQAIRKDVIRALVELVTNCNDSYYRLGDGKQKCDGLIVIEVQRKHVNSVLRIRDYAEGMSGEQMEKTVGVYGAATSGFKDGRSVRGMWGRGLKDAIYGLGYGYVRSIKDDQFFDASLSIRNNKPTFDLEEPVHATRHIRKQYEIPTGNGTVIEIIVSRTDIRLPQFDNIRRQLERHFELRGIMSSSNRRVLLRELDGRGRVTQELQLNYKAPLGSLVLNEIFEVPNTPAKIHLEIFRSNEPLSAPADEPTTADGGLLVISKHVVLALTLFKFENNPYASRFYGRVTCDYIHDLLKKEPPEPVLTATRDGINWTYPFTRDLKKLIEEKLEPLIDEERRRAESEERIAINKKLRKRFDDALKELNSIATHELGKLTGDSDGEGNKAGDKIPFVPPNGFGFVPEYAHVQTGKPSVLTLRASVPDRILAGSRITIESDTPEVIILTPRVIIEERLDYPGVGQALVQIEGRQVGTEAIITARVDGLQADALVKVISKKEESAEPPTPRTRGGLFRDFKFEPNADPKQRVWFDRDTAFIKIATKAPSVSPYLDESGNGADTPQGQVLLAELITDAVCSEIARLGVQRGNFIAVPGAEADAVRREYIRLQSQYAHLVHACFVDPAHRRNGNNEPKRKGRPKLEQD